MLRLRAHRAFAVLALSALPVILPVVLPAQDSTGSGRGALPFALHGFVEVYYRTGDQSSTDSYKLRKADIRFSGVLSPRLRWRIGLDAAKALKLLKTNGEVSDTAFLADAAIDQRGRMLQDAALTYLLNGRTRLDVGQQVIPLSLEGTLPLAKVETIERTMFIVDRGRGAGFGDVRDVGAAVSGTALGSAIEYHLGSFNEVGDNPGSTDPNDQKSVVGRVAIFPTGMHGFQFGGSGAYQGGGATLQRERIGGEMQLRTETMTLRSEFMNARDGIIRRAAWYSLAAVRPNLDWQLVARYDRWDPDVNGEQSLADANTEQIVAGASYSIDNGAGKLAVNLVSTRYPAGNAPSSRVVLIAFQGVW
jgi:Phosphate-selective porin O and P